MSRTEIKTLVIDDDLEICLFFKKFLTQMGHWFKTAHTIREAEMFSKEFLFDLILLDLNLPDGNGVDILPGLLACPSKPEVIIITGTGEVKGAEIAFEYGAWDFVRKPFTFEEITLPITRALQFRKEKKSIRPNDRILRENYNRLRSIYSSLPIVVWATDENGIFTFLEGKMLSPLGLKPMELVGVSIFDYCADKSEIIENVHKGLAGETREYDTKVGDIHFHSVITPSFNQNGELIGLNGISMDISERIHNSKS